MKTNFRMSTKKRIVGSINRDLKKWVNIAGRFKKSSAILQAKLKSSFTQLEAVADLEEINSVQSQLGERKSSGSKFRPWF